MSEKRYDGQYNIIDQGRLADTSFTVVGAGAIGSFFCMALGKMGARKIRVYDHDKLENHNISSQFYPELAVGHEKVKVLKTVVAEFSGCVPLTYEKKFTELEEMTEFMVSCVDNMETRAMIWNRVKNNEKIKWFLDARMGAQVIRVYLINPNDKEQQEFYEKTLYTSDKAVQERCAEKGIIYTVLSVCGIMLNLVRKVIAGKEFPVEVVHDHITETHISTYLRVEPEANDEPQQEADAVQAKGGTVWPGDGGTEEVKKKTPAEMMEEAYKPSNGV